MRVREKKTPKQEEGLKQEEEKPTKRLNLSMSPEAIKERQKDIEEKMNLFQKEEDQKEYEQTILKLKQSGDRNGLLKLIEENMTKGSLFFTSKMYDDSIRCYNYVTMIDPDHALAMVNRAAVYERKGDTTTAIKECEKAIDTEYAAPYPNKSVISEAYGKIGRIYYLMDRMVLARDYVEKALDAEPSEVYKKLLESIYNRIGDLKQLTFDQNEEDPAFFQELTAKKDVEIRKSPVHGRGVFSKKEFKKGELIFFDEPVQWAYSSFFF